jgi:hypothetical protein
MNMAFDRTESERASHRGARAWIAGAATVVIALTIPGMAGAQARPAPRAAATAQAGAGAAPRGIGLRGFALVDVQRMAAGQTFDAVLGTQNLMGFGGGADVLRLWRNAFARVAVSRTNKDGTRVIVFDDESVPVGIGTSVRMMPLEIAGGWQFGHGRLSPYGGGGLLRLSYEETTDFDLPSEDTSATFTGSVLFGGVNLRLAGPLAVGAEVQHRRLADAIGHAGASAAFGENDLGGVTLRVWVGVGR